MGMWRLLLSEYPESILEDNFSLMILTLLERKGMLTEEEMAIALNENKSRLMLRLLALQKNRMVEYSRQYLRVTERGKLLMDRFGLADEIVADVVKPFAVSDHVKAGLKASVLRYRNISFSGYLNSITAVESWRATCVAASQDESSVSWKYSLAHSANTGCLAILLADLKCLEKTSKEKLMTFDYGNIDDASGSQDSVIPVFGSAVAKWLVEIENLRRSENPWQNIVNMDSPSLSLLCAHEKSRELLGASLWREEWVPSSKLFVHVIGCETPSQFRDRLHDYVLKHWLGHHLRQVSKDLYSTQIEDEKNRLIRVPLNDFFLKFMVAEEFEDLKSTVKLDDDALSKLLEYVRSKCETLLFRRKGEEPTPSTENPSIPREEERE